MWRKRMRKIELWKALLKVSARLSQAILLASCLISFSSTGSSASGTQVADLFSIFEPKDNQKIGAQQHPRIVAQYGGEYVKEGLNDFVLDIVLRIVSVTEKKNDPWHVTVLNSPVVNAFALPGGYVYVTRGLLALANTEAEVAGVLAHEVGHVIANHGAQRQSRATGLGLLGALAGILTQSGEVFKLGQAVGGMYLAGYSRDQEYEADQLGVKYLGLAGYPREAMATFLTRLQAQSEYAKKITGKGEKGGQFDFFASHPQTDERIARAKADAAKVGDNLDRDEGRKRYLKHLDGIHFGDDIREGVIQGRWFLHPDLRFKFLAPEEFQLINSARAVYAIDGKGSQMVFDLDPKGLRGLSPEQYLKTVWMKKINPGPIQSLQVGGAQAAAVRFIEKNKGRKTYVTGIVINFGYDKAVRFIYRTSTASEDMAKRISESFGSFQPMQYEEAAKLKQVHINVRKVRKETTVEELIDGMAPAREKKDLFLLLNPAFEGRDPVKGDRYKLPEFTKDEE